MTTGDPRAFADYFSGQAASYARFRPEYPAALFSFVANLPPHRHAAWDCATGNGQAAVALADRFERVIATDASAAQIAHARAHPRVEYRVASAEASGLSDNSVDLVAVAQALHWFDLDRFYAEVNRVLKPDGAIAVWSYDDPVLDDPALDAALQHLNHRVVGPYWPTNRGLVGQGYYALPFPFTEIPAPAMIIERWWTLGELAGYARSWSATVRYIAACGTDPVSLFEADAMPHWGGPAARHAVRWPLAIRAGRLTRG